MPSRRWEASQQLAVSLACILLKQHAEEHNVQMLHAHRDCPTQDSSGRGS